MIEFLQLLLSIYFVVGLFVSLKAGIKDTLYTRQPILWAIFYVVLGPLVWLPIAVMRDGRREDKPPAF